MIKNSVPAYLNTNAEMTAIGTLYRETVFLDRSMTALAYMLEQLYDEIISKLSLEQQDVFSFVTESLRRNHKVIEGITPDHDGVVLGIVSLELDREGGGI